MGEVHEHLEQGVQKGPLRIKPQQSLQAAQPVKHQAAEMEFRIQANPIFSLREMRLHQIKVDILNRLINRR